MIQLCEDNTLLKASSIQHFLQWVNSEGGLSFTEMKIPFTESSRHMVPCPNCSCAVCKGSCHLLPSENTLQQVSISSSTLSELVWHLLWESCQVSPMCFVCILYSLRLERRKPRCVEGCTPHEITQCHHPSHTSRAERLTKVLSHLTGPFTRQIQHHENIPWWARLKYQHCALGINCWMHSWWGGKSWGGSAPVFCLNPALQSSPLLVINPCLIQWCRVDIHLNPLIS